MVIFAEAYSATRALIYLRDNASDGPTFERTEIEFHYPPLPLVWVDYTRSKPPITKQK